MDGGTAVKLWMDEAGYFGAVEAVQMSERTPDDYVIVPDREGAVEEFRKLAQEHAPAARLVPTLPDAEVAADIKKRFDESMKPVLALFDEAKAKGLLIQFDQIGPLGPYFRYGVIGLRVVKVY